MDEERIRRGTLDVGLLSSMVSSSPPLTPRPAEPLVPGTIFSLPVLAELVSEEFEPTRRGDVVGLSCGEKSTDLLGGRRGDATGLSPSRIN